MKRYESESLFKSALLFFLLMTALYLVVAMNGYRDRERQVRERLYSEMKLFSYRPLGKTFKVNFVPKQKRLLTSGLQEGEEGVYAFFAIPGSTKYMMKITLPKRVYERRMAGILEETFHYAPLYLILILILSLFFALYALHPLKKALLLNEEFVKDLLHDLNTPLSAMRINLRLLEKRVPRERSVRRLATSVETIEGLQANLHAFLHRQPLDREPFDLAKLLAGRIIYFQQLYPGIGFRLEVPEGVTLLANEEAFVRIVDNLLSNAAKYNRPGGTVQLKLEGSQLVVEDTGIGIRRPEKVFHRYYKEGERGLGLGLHIVKTLCEAQEIGIALESEPGQGTRVRLDLKKVMEK